MEYAFPGMPWDIQQSDEFEAWWATLAEAQQDDVYVGVRLLEERGPTLRFPWSSGVEGSKHSHMRELRIQSGGRPIRIFYAFDPDRAALLLIGGDKTGNNRFYLEYIPKADAIYDAHLKSLRARQQKQRRPRK
jgi:hypothetical protein